ncbi:glycine betaine transporter OpuD [Clostridium tepidiprofundi DSM 19306]|uniref:Glycine betaine transporter OpuD n=1 Tax=Clostridium tepidiprofundi DSM 19306 TaxID=1121338 RepID=A0A151B247_9CLOT|nr:BCCT family transporter [Clostridium tepidiprofundi]KYH33991.1 glycine betaine transporter OpuD [Clostridium tepidiprofundi DSM 19306]
MKNKNNKSNAVFYISLVISFAIVAWGVISPLSLKEYGTKLFNFLTSTFGWAYLLSMLFFVGFALILAFSKYGNIKLGPDDSKPDYKTSSWFAMLFGAGMGIGLVFWGVAEPISHFVSPPGIQPGTPEAANFAMKTVFMHWGFHPWANYSILGLALAYFQFRKNKPGLVSSIFIPLLGEERVNGPIGKLIDILAVLATVAGVATSLGMGTLQINSGLNFLFKIPETKTIQLTIIGIVTVIYIWTAVSGVEKGIKIISDVNLYVAFGLLILCFMIGPKVKIINSFTNGLGQYLNGFFQDSLHIEAFGDNSWINGWRIFYWAWWIAWAPFVGTFIARISRGRTIREFVMGVIVAPSIASFVWFAVFGTLGINLFDKIGLKGLQAAAATSSTALFAVLQYYHLGSIISFVAVFLLCTFFITSANSATFVLGMLTSEGDLNPSNFKKIIWGLVQALLATALLISGGLKSLQTASVAAAFPFILVMILGSFSLVKALKSEKL